MIKRISSWILISFMMASPAKGQDLLSIDDAVQLAIKNNYDILIAKQEDEIFRNNVYAGNAGMLPNLSLNGSATKSLSNTKLNYSNGETVDQDNAQSSNVNAYAALNWTLFDGLRMFATYDQLKALRDQSIENLKNQVQQSVAQVMTAWYGVWYQKELLRLEQVTDSISNDRLNIAQQRFEVGLGSKLELLQAKVDHNADRSALMNQQVALKNARRALNELMARDINTDFDVKTELPIVTVESLEAIKQKVLASNPQLLAAAKEQQVAAYEIRKQQGAYFPKIALAADYSYTKSTAEASFVQLNQTYGPSVGLLASWTLFNGSIARHETENAKINAFISDLQYSKIKLELQEQAETAYEVYQNNLELQHLETENQATANENLDLASQKYKIGGISGLDFENAKQSFVDAETRLFNAIYNTKVSELGLLQLTGDLVK